MAPGLQQIFTLKLYINSDNTLMLGPTRLGSLRMVGHMSRGILTAEGLEAEMLPNACDWMQINPNTGASYLDIRAQFRTKNGHGIFMRSEGVAQMDEKAAQARSGTSDAQSTQYGDHEWFTTPVFETDHPDWKWLETAVFVTEGRWVVEEDGLWVESQIYRLRPSKQ